MNEKLHEKTTKEVLPKVQCCKCLYYPDNCLYMNKEFQEKNGITRTPDSIHNCRDFRLDVSRLALS